MAALQVVPIPAGAVAPPHSLTLYAIEEQLTAMVDTAELVPPEQEQAFLEEFGAALSAAVEKRDRVGQFLAHLEQQAAFAKAEITRLQERKAFFEHAIDKMEGYVIHVIEAQGPDAKGRYPKLEGKTVTFSIKECPPSVEIRDETAIPADYRTVTVSMSALTWEAVLDSLELEQRAELLDSVGKPKETVSKTAVKKAMDGGAQVPGAGLIVGKKTLIRR